jgi:hypothetical protein
MSEPWYTHFAPSWPKTWPGCVFGIVLVVLLAALIVLYSYDARARDGLRSIVGYFSADGKLGVKVDHVFEFTTASYLTKYDLADAIGGSGDLATKLEKIKADSPWYYVENPDLAACADVLNRNPVTCQGLQVLTFERRLDALKSDKKIQGYEIYESMGTGTHALKRGLTWRITVPEGSKFTRDDVIALYAESWGRKDNIYIEDLSIPKSLWPGFR